MKKRVTTWLLVAAGVTAIANADAYPFMPFGLPCSAVMHEDGSHHTLVYRNSKSSALELLRFGRHGSACNPARNRSQGERSAREKMIGRTGQTVGRKD